MELIDQHTKQIMEGCKERARDAGLRFEDETLEYIVTNRDLLELSPKVMIPTLYDYWVHDVEVLKEKGKYELYPGNPYETVINTRPAISFYNDNNPDWLNVMIFYHVLGHIDFFQSNLFFRHTWDYDFTARALADKRFIARLRAEKGRWVDYVIEFARGIDNLVGFHRTLSELHRPPRPVQASRLDYYFDVFLQSEKKLKTSQYMKEIEAYNALVKSLGQQQGEEAFFGEVARRYPEFDALFAKYHKKENGLRFDLLAYLRERSEFLNREENRWMKPVLQIIRNTSLFLQPQIRTKIMNEGWASYWHEKLFLEDERIHGHEVDYARVNAGVTAMPRVGLNPYALGMRLFQYIESCADKGRFSIPFRRLLDSEDRKRFDEHTGAGQQVIFSVRENLSDFLFINTFLDQDFVTENNLFVTGRRANRQKMTWEYYVKSRKAEDYRDMIVDTLYHPPHVEIDESKQDDGALYIVHHFEGKPLVRDYIPNTLLGIEFLWGGPVKLETSEPAPAAPTGERTATGVFSIAEIEAGEKRASGWQRVLYTMKDRKLSRTVLEAPGEEDDASAVI